MRSFHVFFRKDIKCESEWITTTRIWIVQINQSHVRQLNLIVVAKIRRINAKRKSLKFVRSLQLKLQNVYSFAKLSISLQDIDDMQKDKIENYNSWRFDRFMRKRIITMLSKLINHLQSTYVRWIKHKHQMSMKTKKSKITMFWRFFSFKVTKACCIKMLLSIFFNSIFLSISSENRCFKSNNNSSFWRNE